MADGPRVTFLSEYFYPEESATSQLLTELATRLQNQFDISVVTARPNYHSQDRTRTVPRTETHAGVNITRVFSTRFDKDRLAARILNWVSYTFFTTLQLLRTDTDLVLVVSNPPILPLAAWLRKRLLGTGYVYLIHDVYPEMAIELGLVDEGSPLVRVWQSVSKRLLDDADEIVVLGESMRDELLESRNPDPDITIIHNWVDGEFIEPQPKTENQFAREHETVDSFTLVYSGNVGRFHELETAIDAVAHLRASGHDVKLLIIGEGARKRELEARVNQLDTDAIVFAPFQPYDRLPDTLTCGDAFLVGVDQAVEGLCVSSKLYAGLAAGIPILAVTGSDDEVARVVAEHDCGAHVLPGNVEGAIAELQRWSSSPSLVDELGQNSRQAFEERYTLRHAVDAYAEVFESCLGG